MFKLILFLVLLPAPALACGGFFCDAVTDPVVQTAERVLFRVGDDGTVTTVVEIQFEGEPTDFGWVLPVPSGVDADAVTTAPAGLFDELEDLTAPRFVRPSYEADAAGLYYPSTAGASGCGGFWGCGPGMYATGGDVVWGGPDTSGVEVVGEAVVGPYAIELITAESEVNLLNWLQLNGYQIPFSANQAMAPYVTAGMAFLGLKLQPDVPSGPIDALQFTYPADGPMLPLILTSVAAVADMEVTAYVLADERYAPANYVDLPFDHEDVSWTEEGGSETNYDALVPAAVDLAGGQAWVTELGRPVAELGVSAKSVSGPLLQTGDYLTRFKTVISPEEMTLDPTWSPAPDLGDVSNVHTVDEDLATASPMGLIPFALMVLLGLRRRGPVSDAAWPRPAEAG